MNVVCFAALGTMDGNVELFAVCNGTWAPVAVMGGVSKSVVALAWAPQRLAATRCLWLAMAGDDHRIRLVDGAFLLSGPSAGCRFCC